MDPTNALMLAHDRMRDAQRAAAVARFARTDDPRPAPPPGPLWLIARARAALGHSEQVRPAPVHR